MRYSFEDLITYISRDETLYAGEILGSGTVGGGSGLEAGMLLQSGDIVELEIEGIGKLRNRVIASNYE
jgi:2-keto-4-pentenoate hydratase/2-oxohepta-3-ene-1,7-dioic acid hydratase in catechol pathway